MCLRTFAGVGCDVSEEMQWQDGRSNFKGFRRIPLDVRFWRKVDRNGPTPRNRPDLGPCWIWTAAKDSNGYGNFKINGGYRKAHCIAYELLGRVVPLGLQLDHLCRVPSCVNPDHFEPVTRKENIMRGNGCSARSARRKAGKEPILTD